MQEDYQQDSERYLFVVVVVVLISFILFYFILS